jgi:hypothetical protein
MKIAQDYGQVVGRAESCGGIAALESGTQCAENRQHVTRDLDKPVFATHSALCGD